MTLLVPRADGIAQYCEERLPEATVLSCETVLASQAGRPGQLGDVTFYCLPYMGDAASIALIKDLPSLAVIQSLSSGVDDVLGAVPATATLCNGRDLGHEEGTAELAVALILASLRQLPRFAGQQSRRTWQHVRTESLRGKRVLLAGYGAIGSAIEDRLAPFGARIEKASRTPKESVRSLSDLTELATSADVLIVCIALTTQTRSLIDAGVLAALPDGALIVNVARGPVIDAAALAGELASGRLRAALDVTDIEPLPADRPEWGLPNVLITPHIGGDTFDFARRAPEFVAEQATRHLAGQPLANVIKAARDGSQIQVSPKAR